MPGQISASSGLVRRLTCTSLGAFLGGMTMKLTRNLLTPPVSEQSVRLRGVVEVVLEVVLEVEVYDLVVDMVVDVVMVVVKVVLELVVDVVVDVVL